MSNPLLHPVVNPIIQISSVDTLHNSAHCLSYLSESIKIHPKACEEFSLDAKHGMQLLLDCVRQAIDYEAERSNRSHEPVDKKNPQNAVGKWLSETFTS